MKEQQEPNVRLKQPDCKAKQKRPRVWSRSYRFLSTYCCRWILNTFLIWAQRLASAVRKVCMQRKMISPENKWMIAFMFDRETIIFFFFFGQNKWGFWWGSAGASETLKYRDGKCWRERGVALFFLGSSEVEMFLTRSKSNLHLKPNRKQYHTLPHSRDDLRVRCLRKVSASFGGGKAETRTQTHPTTNRCRGQILW